MPKDRREYIKAWRKAKPDKCKAASDRYRAKHPEKVKAMCDNWHERNKERQRLYMAEQRKKHPERFKVVERRFHLKKNFWMTLLEYQKMFDAQNGVCAICGSPPGKKSLAVDHCHSTGLIRGLLCSMCNRSLGGFRDSQELLASAIRYLEKKP
jgi:formate dehydrogenase maturation protein FdhE